MSSLYDLVNAYDQEGTWLGQFISKDVAEQWLIRKKYSVSSCEISKRRPKEDR